MRKHDNVTLFCPETVSSDGYTWRRYLLRGVTIRRVDSTEGVSAVMYVFDRDVKAYSGGAICGMPKIGPGCAVLPGADFTDTESVVNTLPGCDYMMVQSVKRYHHRGRFCHTKVILG